jgi:hypothetical protein
MADDAGGGHYLTRQDLEALIQRASELDSETGKVPELSETDVVRIASDVGLSEGSIRRALAEYRGGGGELLADHGWLTKVVGSSLVKATREVPRPAEEVRLELENHFQSNESLRLIRRTRGTSLWEPDRGLVSSLLRGLDFSGRGYQLAKKTQAIELDVVPLGEESCHVSLTTDFRSQRAGWFWGLGIGAGVPLAFGTTAVIAGSLDIPNALTALSPAFVVASMALARSGYQKAVGKLRLVLDGLLDRVEHDEPLEPPRPAWRDLLK